MRNRNYHISVWLNENELQHLKEQAAICGISASAFLRWKIMGEKLKPRPPDECKRPIARRVPRQARVR